MSSVELEYLPILNPNFNLCCKKVHLTRRAKVVRSKAEVFVKDKGSYTGTFVDFGVLVGETQELDDAWVTDFNIGALITVKPVYCPRRIKSEDESTRQPVSVEAA